MQVTTFLGLYCWYFFNKTNFAKNLPLISLGTLIIPLIASIIFISFYLHVRNQFKSHLILEDLERTLSSTSVRLPQDYSINSYETENKKSSKQSFDLSIFNSETKIWRDVLITFTGYLVAQISLFIANQTKLIQHDSLLNLILPILILVIMPVIATLITTFKEFLDNITVDFSKNINENNEAVFSY